MSNEIKTAISQSLGVEPVLINSAKVSAQFRQRYYWVGCRSNGKYRQVNIPQPVDRGILLKDVLDSSETFNTLEGKGRPLTANYSKMSVSNFTRETTHSASGAIECVCINPKDDKGVQPSIQDRIYSPIGKSPACTQFIANLAEPLGTMGGEDKAVTLKAQYSKSGVANFCAKSGSLRGATGVCIPVNPVLEGDKARAIIAGYSKMNLVNMVKTGRTVATGCAERVGTISENCAQNAIPSPLVNDSDVYEVKDGIITTKKGHRYPVKLADGFYRIRKLTVSECKRLQTVPEWFDLSVISATQAYKCLGNGWTVEVIAHLIRHALEERPDKSKLDYYL